MNNTISLDQTQPTPTVSIDTSSAQPVSPEVASQRAFKANTGMPKFDFDYGQLYDAFISGREGETRDAAAAFADQQKETYRQQAISQIASKVNGPLSQEDYATVNALVTKRMQPTSPSSVFEEYYPAEYLDSVRQTGEADPSPWRAAHPKDVDADFFRGRDYMSRQEMLRTYVENAEETLKNQGWTPYLIDQAKGLVPGFTQVKQRGLMGAGFFQGKLGENLDDQSNNFFNKLPMDQARTLLQTEGKKLLNDDPSLAVAWGHALLGQSYSEKLLNNMTGIFDVPLGGGLKVGAGLLGKFAATDAQLAAKLAVKSAIQTGGRGPASKALMQEAAGNLKDSAVNQITDEMASKIQSIQGKPFATGNLTHILENPVLSSLTNMPDSFSGLVKEITYDLGRGRLNKEAYNRLKERTVEIGERLVDTINNTIKVDRVPAVDATFTAMRTVADAMTHEYPGLENRILNNTIRYDKSINGHWIDYYLGGEGAQLFKTWKEADEFARNTGLQSEVWRGRKVSGESFQTLEDIRYKGKLAEQAGAKEAAEKYQVQQQGTGFYIKVSKPLPETAYVVRDGLLSIPGSEMPKSWITARFGVYRTPNENLSAMHTTQRLAAQHAPANYAEVVADNNKEIQQLRQWSLPSLNWLYNKATGKYLTSKGQKWNEFKLAMGNVTAARDKETGRLMDVGEFNTLYSNKFHRLPDEQEVAAFHSYKRDEAVWQTFDALNRYKALHRQGAQNVTIRVLDPEKEKAGSVGFTKGHSFHGIPEHEIPSTDQPILFIGHGAEDDGGKLRLGEEKVYKGTPKGTYGKRLAQEIQEGKYQVYRVANVADRPFQGLGKVGEERITHVITSASERENIKWESLTRPRLPDYDAEHFVEQGIYKKDPITGQTWLEGSRTIGAANLRALGKDFVENLNKIRLHLKNGDEAAAMRLHAGTDMSGVEWSTIKDWFHGSMIRDLPSLIKKPATDMDKAFLSDGTHEVGEGFRIKPLLDVDHPVHLVPRNKTIADMSEKYMLENGIRDGTKGGYGRYFEGQLDYRDIHTIDNRGTRQNPLYNMQPTPFVDPMTSINRALGSMIKSSSMDDYKIFAIEHWIQEAKQYLNVKPGELRDNPAYYFYHNENLWSKNPEHTERVQSLKTARMQIQQFAGVQSEHATFVHAWTQSLSDALYAKGYTKSAVAPSWMLPFIKDPFAYIRSATMDAKMGMFAIPQLLVQMQTFTNIFGIAGAKFAAPGSKAAMLHLYAHWAGDEVLDHIDRLASTKLIPGTAGFRPGDFSEARRLLAQTGFSHVGGEHIRLDSPYFDFITSERKQLMNLGRSFFTLGEKSTRVGAWYTAYLEHRAMNPGKITEANVKDILKRADILTINMTRASASRLHEGWMSLPAQFFSYQIRLGELMMGKRLTPTEKFRMFSMNALMYGVPVAYGISGLPIGDIIRKEALENGYVTGDNVIDHLITEGLPSTIIALATGNGDVGKGAHVNFGERFGSSGLEPLRDAMRSDHTVMDLLGGAAFSTFRNTIASLDPWYKWAMSAIRQDDKFKLTSDNFVDPFLEISSVAGAKRMWAAWNTGRWITRNEGYVEPVSRVNAILRTLTGTTSQEHADTRTMQWSTEWIKDDQKKAVNKALIQYRRGIQSQADNDPEQAIIYTKNALTILEQSGYPQERIPSFIALAAKGWEPVIDRAFREYNTGRDVPETRKPQANQSYIQYLEQKNKD